MTTPETWREHRTPLAGADPRRRVPRLQNLPLSWVETGADMQSKYKEMSLGGLAVNFIEC